MSADWSLQCQDAPQLGRMVCAGPELGPEGAVRSSFTRRFAVADCEVGVFRHEI